MPRLLRPFPWGLLGHLSLGIVLAPLLVASLAATALAMPITVFFAAPFLLLSRLFAALIALDRARFQVLGGREVGQPLPPPERTLPPLDQVRAILADPRQRTAAGYAVVRLALAALEFAVLAAVIALPLLVLMGWLGMIALPPYRPATLGFLATPSGAVAGLLFIAAVLSVAAPALLRGLARLDGWVTLTLLGTARTDALERRVGELVEARARTVSAADAERARLERDLHDGAQQRLIALSVLLGQAEGRLAGDGGRGSNPDALALVRRARTETSGTIEELRTLTRGLRPPILQARGLDAALSAVAARLPMPVTIDVRLARRPDPAIEAILYFAVTEALTNVAKHGDGGPAQVEVVDTEATLRATVTDPGPGGADVTEGTGLRGIADRLSGVDGRLYLSSPPGGPTVVTLEVPCG